MRAAFVRQQWENDSRTIATFFFRPPAQYRYEAGQYAVVSLPHDNPDNRGAERTMTLSSAPQDDLLSFTMRLYGDKGSSFKRALSRMQPGDEVTIYEAMGDLVLPLDSSIPLVFVAGGIGIASYVGMVQSLLHGGDHRNLTLLYTVARAKDIVLQQPFDEYTKRFSLNRTVYQPPQRLTAADVLAAFADDALIYLSGTEAMVEELRADLVGAGVRHSRIVFDYFDGYAEL